MEKKKPCVTLISATENPIETIIWNFKIMHNKDLEPKLDFGMSEEEKSNFLTAIANQAHTTVLECVQMTFRLDNVSRAFQQQLTRTRTASYVIASLRVILMEDFADKGMYHTPETIKDERRFHEIMQRIQTDYKHLLEAGEHPENARGILPLNIFSPINLTINLRALSQMADLRLCNFTQGEFRSVMAEIRNEVANKVSPLLAEIFLQSKCDKTGFCTNNVSCGKHPKIKNTWELDFQYKDGKSETVLYKKN